VKLLGNGGKSVAEKFDSELEKFVKTIKEHCDNEDRGIYNQQLALYRRNELWYHGLQFIYWDYVNRDWAVPPSLNYPFGSVTNEDNGVDDYYDYIVNIIKAHGDNYIAALSADIPTTLFPPADTDIPNDVSTARAYNKLSELIDNYNPVKYLFTKLLFTKFIQGIVGIYTYPDTNEKYGTYNVPKWIKSENGELQEVGQETVPKTRVLVEVEGPLTLKFPYYVKSRMILVIYSG
jgi:hypothetical protein